jgi:hypothetical protein
MVTVSSSKSVEGRPPSPGVPATRHNRTGDEVGPVAQLEGEVAHSRRTEVFRRSRDPVHPTDTKSAPGAIGDCLAVSHFNDVGLDIPGDDVPRSVAEAQTLALPDRVEPRAAVTPEFTPAPRFKDETLLLAEIVAGRSQGSGSVRGSISPGCQDDRDCSARARQRAGGTASLVIVPIGNSARRNCSCVRCERKYV